MVWCRVQRLFRAGASSRAPPYGLAVPSLPAARRSSIMRRSISRSRPEPRTPTVELGARDVDTYYDDMVVALSFSGGGMRAAAFSYGVLSGFAETPVTTAASTSSLARSHRLRLGRFGRLGPCRLLRPQETSGTGRLQAALPVAECRARPADGCQPGQHRARPAGRHQRHDGLSQVARRPSVRSRNLQEFAVRAAAARVDQRFGYL